MPNLFLTGYEQETIEEFVAKLLRNGITTVIDVREIPLSRKNGFSKVHLQARLKKLGINYCHFPKLGSPSSIRNDLRSGENDYLDFFKKYRSYVKDKRDIFNQTINIINKNKKTALLCFERNSELCHRSILASELLKINHNMKIIPL